MRFKSPRVCFGSLVLYHDDDVTMKLPEMNHENIPLTEKFILAIATRPRESLLCAILKVHHGTVYLTQSMILAISKHPGLLGGVLSMYCGAEYVHEASLLDAMDEQDCTRNSSTQEHASGSSTDINIENKDAVLVTAIHASYSPNTIHEIAKNGHFTDAP